MTNGTGLKTDGEVSISGVYDVSWSAETVNDMTGWSNTYGGGGDFGPIGIGVAKGTSYDDDSIKAYSFSGGVGLGLSPAEIDGGMVHGQEIFTVNPIQVIIDLLN